PNTKNLTLPERGLSADSVGKVSSMSGLRQNLYVGQQGCTQPFIAFTHDGIVDLKRSLALKNWIRYDQMEISIHPFSDYYGVSV
ncbi:hypothetical protein, partial [Pseudomonas asplenii]|uniref:hypothetical protein n=1 Tax=Pseudomonas asplenii TaxID=53407 RepID=UPI001E46FA73